MKYSIKQVSEIFPDQSVVCIVGNNSIPGFISLSRSEKEYAIKKLRADEEYVFINSLYKITIIVKLPANLPDYKCSEELRKTASKLRKQIKSHDLRELVIASYNAPGSSVLSFAEGLILSFYEFRKYKTVKEDKEKHQYPGKILLHGSFDKAEVKWLSGTCEAVYMARDLINEPPNTLTAPALAREIQKIGSQAGFTVEVLNKGKIEALKMGGLLAVNRGSVDPPVFCILEWKPRSRVNKKPVILTGKGVIYDTGGLNIKTGDYMAQMKADMAGSATVAGVMHVLAVNTVPMHVIGLIPATDNRPGGNAYTQGDVLTMYNKTTVEVCNTDAEGRLILADALSYAGQYNPEFIINIATLTGSASMTFGNQAIAAMGNADRKYFDLLRKSGEEVYERIAELPFWDEYKELLKSEIADIKNVGGREAGAITAGKFLETFTGFPLIHLDIAGTGMLKKEDFYRTKEGPGSGVRLLAAFIRNLAATYRKK
jgi:leucyl aminopeptidase